MLNIPIRDKDGSVMDGITISVATPGTFSRIPDTYTATALDNRELKSTPELEELASWVCAWTGFNNHGKPVPCSPRLVVALFDRLPRIRHQVERAVSDLVAAGRT